MAEQLMYIPNVDSQNYLFCRLQLVVKTLEHSTKHLKFNKSLQSCQANKYEVIIKLLGLYSPLSSPCLV